MHSCFINKDFETSIKEQVVQNICAEVGEIAIDNNDTTLLYRINEQERIILVDILEELKELFGQCRIELCPLRTYIRIDW